MNGVVSTTAAHRSFTFLVSEVMMASASLAVIALLAGITPFSDTTVVAM
jgi:hypothetical protein